MESTGIIVVLSYPDTVVRPAYTEFSSKIWPLLGVGTKDAVQAGHAALLLIEKETGKSDYFDFGRYITSFGYGRVRSKETDVELGIPIEAIVQNDELVNINEYLLWLDNHPEKTHGEGRLVASVNMNIDYGVALDFVNNLIDQKQIPYGAFVNGGSNCARFVTDTVLASCVDKSIKRKLKTSNLFTPSPIGNAIKATTEKTIYVVAHQKIVYYENRSVLKEYFSCFLNKYDTELNGVGTELPNLDVFDLENGFWLGGIGSGAWFKIEEKVAENQYQISRYTAMGSNDFVGHFELKEAGFLYSKPYQIVHPTNCKEVVVVQGGKEFLFQRIS